VLSNYVNDNSNNNIFTLYLASFSIDAHSLDSLLFGLVYCKCKTYTHTQEVEEMRVCNAISAVFLKHVCLLIRADVGVNIKWGEKTMVKTSKMV